jgi:hypothetical protein
MMGTAARNTDPHQKYWRSTPPHQWADRGAYGEARRPDRHREGALPVIEKHVPDQGERRRREGGAGHAEKSPRRDQRLSRLSVGSKHRGHAERCSTEEEQPSAAEAIPQRAHGDQRPSQEKAVDVEDPKLLDAARLQVRRDRGNSEVEKLEIH